MKRMKKIFAMLLALTMVLGMTMTASAETKDKAIITVKNASEADISYLQVIEPDTTSDTGWKFSTTEIATAYKDALGVADDASDTDEQTALVMLIKFVNESAKVPSAYATVQKATSAQIDTALASLATNTFGNANIEKKCTANEEHTVADGKCTTEACTGSVNQLIEVSKAGVYAVRGTETGYTYKVMAAYVAFGTVNETYDYPSLEDTDVTAKKSPTSVTKDTTDPEHAVAIGDIIEYSIVTYIPYIDPVTYNEENSRTFKITDKIIGAEYYLAGTNSKSSVTIEGQEGQAGTIVVDTTTAEGYDASFTIDLSNWVKELDNKYAGSKVTVTYTAKATKVTTENSAFSHVPDSDYEGNKVNIYTGSITLTKLGETESVKLENAGFKVYKETGKDENQKPVYSSALTFKQDVELNDDGTVKTDAEGNEIKIPGQYTYDPAGTVTEVFTAGKEGTVTVKGLDEGTYWFEETTAPEGYSINETDVSAILDVTTKNADDEYEANAVFTATTSISDTKLIALPSTGGIGTTIFTVAGCGIMIAAAFFFFASRKKEN